MDADRLIVHVQTYYSETSTSVLPTVRQGALVIVHVHLKAPIMIGIKKADVSGNHYLVHASFSFTVTQDIQFFREASDVQFDETGNW